MGNEIYFTDDMQKEIYSQVFGKNRKWLNEAVAYVKRTRKQYPPDDLRWTDQVIIDHVLYYVNVANAIQKDATLDDRNILVGIRQWLDNNPHPLPVMPTSHPPEPTPEASYVLDVLEYDVDTNQYTHRRATPEEHDAYAADDDGLDLEAEMIKAMSAHIASEIDTDMTPDVPPASTPFSVEVGDLPSDVVEAALDTIKDDMKKKASKKKATKKKKTTKKKTTKKKND